MCVRRAAACVMAATVFVSGWAAEAQTPSWAKVSPEQVAAAKKLGVPVAFENSVGMRFVLIPAGTFMMGSGDSMAKVAENCNMPNAQPGWFADEHPQHKVTLTKPFYMGVSEVTQAQYAAVIYPPPEKKPEKKDQKKRQTIMDGYPDEFKGADMPVIRVSWDNAKNFCQRLSQRDEGKYKYALPTEAQWEYACRAGTVTPFSFGETVTVDQVNYHGAYPYGQTKKGTFRGKPVPAGSLPPNPWGLHEMHGNVNEYCADHYSEYDGADQTDPTGPEKGQGHVVRGGSYRSYAGACRSAFRVRKDAGDSVGFRVCCPLPTEKPDEKKDQKKK